MGVANVPSAAGGGIKSVQRGSAGGAGNVTITAVDITKSFVTVFGTASTGTVAATGSISFQGEGAQSSVWSTQLLARNITGGSNNLVVATVQGFLANATTLTVSDACRFEVVEFA